MSPEINPFKMSTTWQHVLDFAQTMEEKLAENRHKGDRDGWLKCDPWALFKRIKDEVTELERDLEHCCHPDSVARECADIANFAMMVADAYRERHTKKT